MAAIRKGDLVEVVRDVPRRKGTRKAQFNAVPSRASSPQARRQGQVVALSAYSRSGEGPR